MITLITGGPGTGKTLYVVDQLLKFDRSRPLYVDGVTDLQIPHEKFDPLKWPDEIPDGSLLVIDEVQRVWRPSAPGAALLPSIAGLETHRHKGLDFFIMTQHPSLVHQNVRRLVGKHIHLVANWSGRKLYEWPETQTDPQTGRHQAASRPYSLSKQAMGAYKSAEIHTKQNRRLPLVVFGLAASLVLVVLIGYYVYGRVGDLTKTNTPHPVAAVSGNPVTGSKGANIFDFKPRVPSRPETAPAYDGMLKVVDAPSMRACILKGDECKCYTSQATPYPAPDPVCRDFVAGNIFNPFYKPAPPPEPLPTQEKDLDGKPVTDSSRLDRPRITGNEYQPGLKSPSSPDRWKL